MEVDRWKIQWQYMGVSVEVDRNFTTLNSIYFLHGSLQLLPFSSTHVHAFMEVDLLPWGELVAASMQVSLFL